MARGSWLVARGSWLVARGVRLVKKCLTFIRNKVVRLIIPRGKVIIFESNPDFSCNTYPVYRLLKKFLPDYKMVWLIKHGTTNKDADDTIYVDRLTRFENWKFEYYMLRCKILVQCNILHHKFRRKQISIFLTHGSKTKKVKGVYDMQSAAVDYVCVQSHFFDDAIIDDYNCRREQLIYTGYPRCDYFYREKVPDIAEILTGRQMKFIIWLPTFRVQKGKFRDDAPGSKFNNIGVPLFYSIESLKDFNAFLQEQDIHILYKPHPAQDLDFIKNEPLSNFHVIYDSDILSKNLQLYQVIAQSQALITDYSSVFWDYLLLDRPIAVTVDDLESWKNARGFVFDIESVHKESAEILATENNLRQFIANVINKRDIKQQGRRKFRDLANIHQDGNSALRVTNFILEKLGRKHKIIGYVNGVFDMFHAGHLNIIYQAKKRCDYLIVGVYSDEIVKTYKPHAPIINENDRQKIVNSIKCVDYAFVSSTRDQLELWNKYKFDTVFVGDDWKGTERWNKFEKILAEVGVKVEYIPYTQGISTTILREKIKSQEEN